MPAPDITENEIRFRQVSPKGFVRIRRKVDEGGEGIDFVFGFKEGGGSQIQSIVFDKSKFTVASARAWLKSHKFKTAEGEMPENEKFTSPCSLSEAKFDKAKKEITLTLLQEGPGNLRDNRYYTRACIESSGPVMMSRRKMFLNHLKEGQNFGDTDIKDWSATLKETFTVEDDNGILHRKGRLKIHDDWLWTRCEEAPEEIAVSIEGQGAGHADVINGKNYHAIEKIVQLNGTKFVPYSGNATMGATLVESETNQEDEMKIEDLTAKELQEARPELVEEITKAAAVQAEKDVKEAKKTSDTAAAAKAGDTKALIEQVKTEFTKQIDEVKSATGKTIEALKKDLTDANRKVDASDIRERIVAKKNLVDLLIKESDLPSEAKTKLLHERCYAITERKGKDKDGKEEIQTVEAQVIAEINEQKRLVTGEFGHVRESGKPEGDTKLESEDLNEAEENHLSQKFLTGTKPAEFRKVIAEFRAEQKKKEEAEVQGNR